MLFSCRIQHAAIMTPTGMHGLPPEFPDKIWHPAYKLHMNILQKFQETL